jgi:hypothetical protein
MRCYASLCCVESVTDRIEAPLLVSVRQPPEGLAGNLLEVDDLKAENPTERESPRQASELRWLTGL